MNVNLQTATRDTIFEEVASILNEQGFNIIRQDRERPWGGFFAIQEDQVVNFAKIYFPELPEEAINVDQKLSPKILLVGPDSRLSWQYHHRRSEVWRVTKGTAGVITSDTDEQGPLKELPEGTTIHLAQGERHRLIGLKEWSIIAEIWQHSDPNNPSNEDDIVRVQDDFGRK
ncbi:MAG: phosphoheptose isomerase [Bacteroidota bacterium]